MNHKSENWLKIAKEDFDSLCADITEARTSVMFKEARKIFLWLEKKLK